MATSHTLIIEQVASFFLSSGYL